MSDFNAADAVTWLQVDVDSDGLVVVRDLVEGNVSEPIETVMVEPAVYADAIRDAIVDLMRKSGLNL